MGDVDTSVETVVVNHNDNTWQCPLCKVLHQGYHGKKHAYCIHNNIIFQIEWRLQTI